MERTKYGIKNKRCKTCYGFGMWVDMTAPMGPTDARDRMPTVECPECKANSNPIQKRTDEQSNTKRTENGTEWVNEHKEFFLAWDIGERILIIQFIQDLLKEKDEFHERELAEAYRRGCLDITNEACKEVIANHKKKLKEAIKESYKIGKRVGIDQHHIVNEKIKQLYSKYNLN